MTEKNENEVIINRKLPIHMKVNLDFKELVEEIQDERVKEGMEKTKNKISLDKITKAISNLINANPKIKKMLVEVEINKKNGKI